MAMEKQSPSACAEEDGMLSSETETENARRDGGYRGMLKKVCVTLAVMAAILLLIATMVFPVLEISGDSMMPTLENGSVVLLWKTNKLKQGDICCFYYNNYILVKRVIAVAGDTVEMDDAGNVTVNGVLLEEPYVSEKMRGECDLRFPYTVPEETIFVLGDHREIALDSRNAQIGAVSVDEVIGKLIFCLWPFDSIGVPQGG